MRTFIRLLAGLVAVALIPVTLVAGGLPASGAVEGENGRLSYATGSGAYFEVGITGTGVINPGENSRAPAWSPTAAEVVYNTLSGLTIRNVDGTNPVTLVAGTDPAWSPDGSQIVYKPPFPNPLAIINRDGSAVPITLPEGDNPAWSPDGTTIAYNRGGALWRFDLATETETILLNDGFDNRWPDWSPDGSQIAYTRIDTSGPSGATGILVIVDANNGNEIQAFPAPGPNAFDVVPAWSPDGELIAIERQPDGADTGIYTLSVANPTASAVLVVDDPLVSEGHPSWETLPATGCTIEGTSGDDILLGTPGDDVICGFGGDDVILAYGGNDHVIGGPGHDTIRGGQGDDLIEGEGGRDRLYGGPGADTLDGGDGRDRLYGGTGPDQLFGGAGRDRLLGGFGNDALDGGPAVDRCIGGPGADTLVDC